jgi:outer membrane protein assembly factor BamB
MMSGEEPTIARRDFLASLALLGLQFSRRRLPAGQPRNGPTRSSPVDWPVYRHDVALTGVSPGKGRIVTPNVQWEYDLGVPYEAMANVRSPDVVWSGRARVADLDGDGRLERILIDDRTLRITDPDGRELWTYTVEGLPLGVNVRVCNLLRPAGGDGHSGGRGLQVISFSNRMDNGQGQGYCFTFDRGAERGELLWTTGPLTGQYSPTLVVDDVDGDGWPEIVMAPHSRVQIFNGQTGALKAEIPWSVGRNYGALLTRPRHDRPQKDIYVISDFVLHVDRLGFENGAWAHAWGHKYVEPDAPTPVGREKYLRVGPNPVADLDGDGHDEMAYMLVDATADDRWHLRVRDAATGRLKADLAGIWLWTIADLDGDGRVEIAYTPIFEKRPRTYCDVHIARFTPAGLRDVATLKGVRPIQMPATLPLSVDSIADDGVLDWLRTDLNGDRVPELFCARPNRAGSGEDRLEAWSLSPSRGTLVRTWRFGRAGHRLNLVSVERGTPGAAPAGLIGWTVSVRDLTSKRALTIDSGGRIVDDQDLGRPSHFSTTPIVVDLDGDGRNEIVVQNAAAEIIALRPGTTRRGRPTILWSIAGVAMNPSPGYGVNGGLCPQAGDVDGDGLSEVLFASEDSSGRCALTCVDGRGRRKWRRSIEGSVWGGLQTGVDLWTFGRFRNRARGLDVYVDLHRRSKGSGEGWMLDGLTGKVVWRQRGLIAKDTAMPFGGGLPAVADVDGDGVDELVQMFYTVYGAVSGRSGEPLFPPALLAAPSYFGKWLAYSSPTIADLDGDGRPEVYLNRANGGYAAVRVDGRPLWGRFHDNDLASTGFGPVGDLDGDGRCEIGVPVCNGTLVCLDAADGRTKWTVKTPVTGDVVAADIDGDGVLELIFAGTDGKMRAVSGKDGHELWAIDATGRPVIADVDGDGFVEILAVGSDGILRVIG